MAHQLWLVKSNKRIDITPIVSDLSWRSNKDELGIELSFTIANGSKYMPKNPCSLGDMVILKNGKYEITRGILLNEKKSGKDPVEYAAYEYGFYLNKSDAVYRFKKMRADDAIRKILRDFGIPIGEIPFLSTSITQIYNNKKISDILKSILRQVRHATGKRYILEQRNGKMCVILYKSMKIQAVFKMDGTTYKATDFIADPSRELDVTSMINTIQVISDEKVILTKSDGPMLRKYGKLQKTISVDKKKKKEAAKNAQSELDELSKVIETTKVVLLGDDKVKAGRVIELNEKYTGIKGNYTIKDVTHTVSNGIHKMSVNMEG